MVVITGVVSFYIDFLENLYDLLDGTASITGKTWLLLSSYSSTQEQVHVLQLLYFFWVTTVVILVLTSYGCNCYNN